MKKFFFIIFSFLFLIPILHCEEKIILKKQNWTFEGIFGRYDDLSLQRGLQIYQEVCSACHGMKRVRFREFADSGIKLQLLFWIYKPEIRGRTVDAVNTEIYKQFKENKILIAYPTMKLLMPEK